ncbi:hypothetical protein JTB14_026598 [Gonioctena quinquepunctata]|nr:hypothetical protein JTB14_026598 [Gonioctena quinquepunctata]
MQCMDNIIREIGRNTKHFFEMKLQRDNMREKRKKCKDKEESKGSGAKKRRDGKEEKKIEMKNNGMSKIIEEAMTDLLVQRPYDSCVGLFPHQKKHSG